MQHPVLKFIAKLEKFSKRIWYTPAIAVLAALDLFILVIPTDALLISNSALRPKRWVWIALQVALGSALGSLVLAWAIQTYGTECLVSLGIHLDKSPGWHSTAELVRAYQGPAMAVFALGPFPLQPAVALGAMAEVNPGSIFFWVAIGRAVKFLFFAWAATHAPNLLSKIWPIKTEIKAIEEGREEIHKAETEPH